MPVVPLSRVDAEDLEELQEAEIELWQSHLFWDYRPATRLICKYMSAGTLQGFAALDSDGTTVGYSYYVISEPVLYIGNIFAGADSGEVVYRELLEALLAEQSRWEGISRVEGQIFPFHCDLTGLFRQHSFRVIERHSLARETEENPLPTPSIPSGFRVLDWQDGLLEPAARVIYDSYQHSDDFDLCHDYQSPEGCVRFMHNIVDNPGCGTFNRQTSCLAMDSRDRLCAVLLTSNISAGTGMVPQISVRPDCQNCGLGSYLIRRYLNQAHESGLERAVLSVSETNPRAERLYRRLGFSHLKTFHAFIKELTGPVHTLAEPGQRNDRSLIEE